MAKTEGNLKSAEDFVRLTLEKNFGQKLDSIAVRETAAKLCDAIPERVREAA